MIELLTNAEMAAADRLTIANGTPSITLMENAGRAVANAVTSRFKDRRVLVVAGPGNNGGDGFVAARLLAERGHGVSVVLLGDRAQLKGDAAQAAQRWKGLIIAATPDTAKLIAADNGDNLVIIDALFGAGLDRPVEGLPRAMIEAMNAGRAPIIAVDLPSGVNGTTGAVMGAAVKAHHTVTFFRRKTGHLLLPGREFCGTIDVADIGIPQSVLDEVKSSTWLNDLPLWRDMFPIPRAQDHKYARGHVVVVSGGISTTGAARLAARAALRAGAGVVTLATPRHALMVNAATSLAVMVHPVDGADELREFLADTRRNALVIGPGGGIGSEMRENVRAALASRTSVVLDADALTSFAEEPSALFSEIRKRLGQGADVILTPHEGEFTRLFRSLDIDPKYHSKLEKARLAARTSGAVMLLKGADTVVAAPDGRASIAANAPAYLATAGSGDVLAGIAAALLAQHMPAFEAASAAVWLHGEAAQAFGPGLISEDLPEMLPRVYRQLYGDVG